MVLFQTYNSEILADFNLVERYSIVICIYAQKKFWGILVSWSIRQTATIYSQSNFPAVLYSNCHLTNTCEG